MTEEARIGFLDWETNAEGSRKATGYSQFCKNFMEEHGPGIREILRDEYNVRIDGDDLVFACGADATLFLLRWS